MLLNFLLMLNFDIPFSEHGYDGISLGRRKFTALLLTQHNWNAEGDFRLLV
jgi:hypothetical protein